jgi:predicted TIM-barrel fold metal-dependent hydrolase
MYAGFRPDEPRLDPLWTYASKHKLPVLLHTGTTFVAQAPLECTLPRHLDPVAIRFPEVKIIMAHLGHPYEGECIVTIRKHPNVYADISALHYRPFQLYHSLMLVQEYGVWNKVLFGTDYPFTTVNATIEGLRKLNNMTEGTGLPKLNQKAIEEMIYRDSLTILGLNQK